MYNYIKALHIIFVVTWFSGLFYTVRLFIYNTEAGEKSDVEKAILHPQFNTMIKRLWFGITWPSAVLTLIFGTWLLVLYGRIPPWLWTKLFFVTALFLYHLSLHYIFNQQMEGRFRYTSKNLRIWNEVATIFLVTIVMLVVVKQQLSFVWGLLGFVLFAVFLMAGIRIYRLLRSKNVEK